MRLRGFAPLCQPKEGFIRREDDQTGRYHDIIVYNRELTVEELRDYELDFLGGRELGKGGYGNPIPTFVFFGGE